MYEINLVTEGHQIFTVSGKQYDQHEGEVWHPVNTDFWEISDKLLDNRNLFWKTFKMQEYLGGEVQTRVWSLRSALGHHVFMENLGYTSAS